MIDDRDTPEEERLIRLASNLKHKPTPEEFDSYLRHSNPKVIIAWLKRDDIPHTKEQAAWGRRHRDHRVNVEWYWRELREKEREEEAAPPEVKAAKKAAEEAKKEADRLIGMALNADSMINPKKRHISDEEFEKYITHPNRDVRAAWAMYGGREKYGWVEVKLTDEQIRRGRNDPDIKVRQAWEQRVGYRHNKNPYWHIERDYDRQFERKFGGRF
jgi:hypothetical protein